MNNTFLTRTQFQSLNGKLCMYIIVLDLQGNLSIGYSGPLQKNHYKRRIILEESFFANLKRFANVLEYFSGRANF